MEQSLYFGLSGVLSRSRNFPNSLQATCSFLCPRGSFYRILWGSVDFICVWLTLTESNNTDKQSYSPSYQSNVMKVIVTLCLYICVCACVCVSWKTTCRPKVTFNYWKRQVHLLSQTIKHKLWRNENNCRKFRDNLMFIPDGGLV